MEGEMGRLETEAFCDGPASAAMRRWRIEMSETVDALEARLAKLERTVDSLLPTLMSLRGIAPDITGGMPSEEFVRKLRSEGPAERHSVTSDIGRDVLHDVAMKIIDVTNAGWHAAAGGELRKIADETESGRLYLSPMLDAVLGLIGGSVEVFLDWAAPIRRYYGDETPATNFMVPPDRPVGLPPEPGEDFVPAAHNQGACESKGIKAAIERIEAGESCRAVALDRGLDSDALDGLDRLRDRVRAQAVEEIARLKAPAPQPEPSALTRNMVAEAERRALHCFDAWNDVAGIFVSRNSYYGEITGVIEDAVHCGIQMAMFGDVQVDEDGSPIRGRFLPCPGKAVEEIARLKVERDEARANYRWMVERAADGKPGLEGYRELGQKVAEAEAEVARLKAQALPETVRLVERDGTVRQPALLHPAPASYPTPQPPWYDAMDDPPVGSLPIESESPAPGEALLPSVARVREYLDSMDGGAVERCYIQALDEIDRLEGVLAEARTALFAMTTRAETAEARLAEARAKVDDMSHDHGQTVEKLRQEAEKERVDNARLHADAERLDWLGNQRIGQIYDAFPILPDRPTSWREAIDAARKAEAVPTPGAR